MCGIVGMVGGRDVTPVLMEGLRRLEYRGYDSAGLAVINGGRLQRLRRLGKVRALQDALNGTPLSGASGIAHTRWATHGKPSETNAHPHTSGGTAVVHNGIIENHEALRGELEAHGYRFASETDTEVIVHRIVSAEGAIFSGEVEMVFAPGALGEIGIAPRHAPLLTHLKPGEVRVQPPEGEEQFFFVTGGVLEVQPRLVTVLADSGARAEDLDEAAALAARERAREALEGGSGEIDLEQAQRELVEAEARYRAAEKLKGRR